ncbi:MAG: short-chain dehydrogenase/reductase [Sphingomonas bacterium]|uniref:SDR family NAD(P)-dependent oxidoreductase n=1 Tax=Sphingomonas bacterium TaxID=1895847 RepID=UPI002612F243|nr:SDR family NAD(P)-dependent oxidoreductase [Sphingomonas bacterium]MDB5712451.1 short-chain dehydrogenase/reductase [Sphingomonas bacterium]
MSSVPADLSGPTILIIGASRGLGHGLAAGFIGRRWNVIGTVRGTARTDLHDLADAHPDRVTIETLDIDQPEQIAALRDRLSGRAIDVLFVNAGTTTHDQNVLIGTVPTEEFVRVMVTNTLSPMRAIEALQDLVPADGLIGVMSSGQGSIANNEVGMREVYRSSKAALNMAMRSFAARQPAPRRAARCWCWRRAGSAPISAAPTRPSRWRKACRCWSTCCSPNACGLGWNISTAMGGRWRGESMRPTGMMGNKSVSMIW